MDPTLLTEPKLMVQTNEKFQATMRFRGSIDIV